jgi:hypothetical protein
MLIHFCYSAKWVKRDFFDSPGKKRSSRSMPHFMDKNNAKQKTKLKEMGCSDGKGYDNPQQRMDLDMSK